MDTDKFEQIGLTKQQSRIYTKLLELGPSNVGALIKHLDIARISCYDTLNRLISKGLVSFVKVRGNRVYQATDPSNLLKIAQDKESETKKQREIIEDLLPNLNKLKLIGEKESNDATIYKTKEGMKSVFELMLKTDQTIYTISATGNALSELKYYFPEWHRRREKQKLKTYIIFNDELKNKNLTKMPLSEIKYTPKEYSSPSTLFIFGDYTVTLLWSDVPFAFLIKSKNIAESYKNYFKLIWKIAKP
jgi:sugar-specific transcriptional regulator TrmB